MLVVTLGSLFMVSILIGTLTSSIEAKVDDLRKGRSRVIENNHTLILGWSPQIFTILSELMIANENQKKAPSSSWRTRTRSRCRTKSVPASSLRAEHGSFVVPVTRLS
jgi:hypothetical protein